MTPIRRTLLVFVVFVCALLWAVSAAAQDNYEIQVYAADTVDPGATMVEFHTNFTFQGRKTLEDGVAPTNHALHETLELTHGWNKWFETGFYVFTAAEPHEGWQYVGSHLRPRVRVPEDWHWPVGVSVSTEVGYVRPLYSADTWTMEIRPIVDKKIGKTYLAFNPAFEKSFRGPAQNIGWEFSPGAKISYDVTKKVAAGIEYYASLGPVDSFDPLAEQEQQIIPNIDVDFGKNWEFNLGAGWGATRSTDHFLLKMIVGYRFDKLPWSRNKKETGKPGNAGHN
jgi:hypothetical protein